MNLLLCSLSICFSVSLATVVFPLTLISPNRHLAKLTSLFEFETNEQTMRGVSARVRQIQLMNGFEKPHDIYKYLKETVQKDRSYEGERETAPTDIREIYIDGELEQWNIGDDESPEFGLQFIYEDCKVLLYKTKHSIFGAITIGSYRYFVGETLSLRAIPNFHMILACIYKKEFKELNTVIETLIFEHLKELLPIELTLQTFFFTSQKSKRVSELQLMETENGFVLSFTGVKIEYFVRSAMVTIDHHQGQTKYEVRKDKEDAPPSFQKCDNFEYEYKQACNSSSGLTPEQALYYSVNRIIRHASFEDVVAGIVRTLASGPASTFLAFLNRPEAQRLVEQSECVIHNGQELMEFNWVNISPHALFELITTDLKTCCKTCPVIAQRYNINLSVLENSPDTAYNGIQTVQLSSFGHFIASFFIDSNGSLLCVLRYDRKSALVDSKSYLKADMDGKWYTGDDFGAIKATIFDGVDFETLRERVKSVLESAGHLLAYSHFSGLMDTLSLSLFRGHNFTKNGTVTARYCQKSDTDTTRCSVIDVSGFSKSNLTFVRLSKELIFLRFEFHDPEAQLPPKSFHIRIHGERDPEHGLSN